jgi:vancomycin resistance protein YoaR
MAVYAASAGLLLLCGCSFLSSDRNSLGEKISIDGIDMSLMDINTARTELFKSQAKRRSEWKCAVTLDGKTVELTGNELPVLFNSDEVFDKAMGVQEWQFLDAEQRAYKTVMSLDMKSVEVILERIKKELDVPFKNASSRYAPEADGKFEFKTHTFGKSVDVDKIADMINASMIAGEKELLIKAPYDPIKPVYTEEMARFDNTLISSFTTSFEHSPHNAKGRVFNINKAAGIIDGYILNPGEEFDMNAVLGPRTEETGWKQAPGIRYGKYEMEYGGGVCQVSSTLFNSVMMADLKVTERRPHSWPLTYIPIGRDATISTGGPNFKFINTTEAPILISTFVDNKKQTITMEIYGQPLKDGMTIKISSKRTGTIANPGEEIILDNTLSYGTRVEERESRAGRKSITYKEYYDKNGELIDRVIAYEDMYPPIKGLTYVSADIFYGFDDEEPDEPEEYENGDTPSEDSADPVPDPGGQIINDIIFG